jgi:hypothetical protein
VPLADRDLPHFRDAVGHLPHREALWEDDPEGDRRSLGRTSCARENQTKDRNQRDELTPSHRL